MAEPVRIWHKGSVVQRASAFDMRPWAAVRPELVDSAARLLAMPDISGVAIAHEDPNRSAMVCVVSCGTAAPPAGTLLDASSGISGRCVRENRMLHSYDALIDPRVNHRACEELGIRSLAIAPLQFKSRCIGVLEVFSEQPGTFNAEIRNKVEEEATLVAALLHQRDDSELTGSQEDPANATGTLPVEPVSNLAVTPDAESSLRTTESSPMTPPRFHTSFPAADRPWARTIVLVVAPLVGILALLSVRIAAHKINRARLSSTVAISPTPKPTRVIAQSPAAPAKSSEYEGDGVVSAPARKLIESATSGNVKAQVSIADRYSHGDDVHLDKVKAATWYIVAGAHGSERAKRESVLITRDLPQFDIAQIRFNVGKMYSDGIGGQPDLVAAYSWFALAQAAGDVRASAEQEKLERVMSSAQVSEAFHRASSWLAAHRAHHSRDTIAAYASKSP
jgi:TPR repeat protein